MSINIERSFRKEKITSFVHFPVDRKKRERTRSHSWFISSFDRTLLSLLKRFVRVQHSSSKRWQQSTCLPDIRKRNDWHDKQLHVGPCRVMNTKEHRDLWLALPVLSHYLSCDLALYPFRFVVLCDFLVLSYSPREFSASDPQYLSFTFPFAPTECKVFLVSQTFS